jgi:hypothetical protein
MQEGNRAAGHVRGTPGYSRAKQVKGFGSAYTPNVHARPICERSQLQRKATPHSTTASE